MLGHGTNPPAPYPFKADFICVSSPKCQAGEGPSTLSTPEKMRSPNNEVSVFSMRSLSFQTQSFQNASLALREWIGFRTKSKHQIFTAYHSPNVSYH